MSDTDPIAFQPRQQRGGADAAPAGQRPEPAAAPGANSGAVPDGFAQTTRFTRHELSQILDLYCRKVAAGEWRDYAIDMLKDTAVFSVFRRSSEFPIYRIEKSPKLARRQGAFSIVTPSGLIVKRGHELDRVLKALDKRLSVVEG